MSPVRDESGTSTVTAVALSGVLMLLGLSFAWVGAVVADHRAAQAAADLSALAGAGALQYGRDGCAAAGRVAAANRAAVASCQVSGDEVRVEVEVSSPALFGRTPHVTGRARAGPAPAQVR